MMSIFDEFKIDRAQLFARMREANITHAFVDFSGGNDEGGADNIRVVYADGTTGELSPYDDDENVLVKLLSRLPYEKYYTFAGDFSVHGTITVQLEDESVVFNGHESVWDEVEETW